MELAKQQDAEVLIQTLQDAGCDRITIDNIMWSKAIGNEKEVLRLLTTHRAFLLCKIHEAQQPLDTLDYLLFKLKKRD